MPTYKWHSLDIQGRLASFSIGFNLWAIAAVGVLPAAAISGGYLDADGHPNAGAIMVPTL